MALTWKTSFSGKECRIFRDKLIVGILKTSIWKGDAYGELNGYMLLFKPLGFWKRSTQILDIEGKKVLGKIEYNWWKSSAVITYEEVTYEWKYLSWNRKRWDVKGPEESAVFLLSSLWRNEGNIEYDDTPGAVILAALYVQGYFAKITASAA
ncbi:hypothetical protein [Dyadobacter sp. NIV53]|uniref:hypothetical protein n=1 Tax=Dyadobacter sp. NIV53 TaxID=2861765 RepID=UPI001C863E6C|nr:hypothetical protein [Dyadobacter sp. NIV53]